MTSPRPITRWWAFLLLGTCCYYGVFAFHPRLFWYVGVNDYGVWFLDSFAILASNDALARGLDPFVPNALDYFGRPHVYSHWWLKLHGLGLTRAQNFQVGLTLVVLFVLVVFAWLRPKNVREFFFYAAILCSSPLLLAVNRANNDLVIFVLLAPLVASVLDRRAWAQWVAPLLIGVAAGLKYYPASAALLAIGADDRAQARLRVLLTVIVLALVIWNILPDLRNWGPLAPQPEGLLTFGGPSLFHALGWDGLLPKLLVLAIGGVVFVLGWCARRFDVKALIVGHENDWLHFILGAVLLAGCFFTSRNFGYRWVFAIWLAPFLWSLVQGDRALPIVRLGRLAATLLIVVLWLDAVACFFLNRFVDHVSGPTLAKWADRAFLLEQPFVWVFFCCLVIFLAQFTREGWERIRGAATR